MSDPSTERNTRDLHPLVGLWPFIRPYRGVVALALLALSVAALAMLALPVAVRHVIDQGFAGQDSGAVNQLFIALFAISVVFAIFAALRHYLVSWLGERIVADIRSAVYEQMLEMDQAFYEVTRTGEVLSRLTADTTLLQSAVGSSASIALRSLFMLVGGLMMLAVTSPRLAGLIVVLVPLVIVPLLTFGRRVRRLSRDSQDRIADTSALAGETLNAIQTVQAYTLEGHFAGRFGEAVEAAFLTARRRVRARSMLSACAVISVFGAVVLVLWFGARSVIAGSMSAGDLSQFVLYAVIVAGATAAVSEVWGEVQRAAGAMERIMELYNGRPGIAAPAAAAPLPKTLSGRVSLHQVSFHYPSRPSQPALVDFSLSVAPGETVALVGPSGAGKSTVFQLLLRYYDPQTGHITLDGMDIRATDPKLLRRSIGIVPQETVIFAADAMENIRLGRPEAGDDEVRAAARAALADGFLERQPQGYRTFLGERGLRLSGGQRQRIAIARAILKNAPILLLDEATSALDAESERLVQEALSHLIVDCTTLVIAHRLATVLKADRIVVIDSGRMVATGSHQELLGQGGLYARLAALQFGAGAVV